MSYNKKKHGWYKDLIYMFEKVRKIQGEYLTIFNSCYSKETRDKEKNEFKNEFNLLCDVVDEASLFIHSDCAKWDIEEVIYYAQKMKLSLDHFTDITINLVVKSRQRYINTRILHGDFNEIEEVLKILISIKDDIEMDENYMSTYYDENFIDRKIDDAKTFYKTAPIKELPQPTTLTIENHLHIFANNGFELFEYLLGKAPKSRGRTITIHFYYHQLKDRDYIRVKHTPFIEWYNKIYNVDLGETKRKGDTTNNTRTDTSFKDLLDLYQQQQNN